MDTQLKYKKRSCNFKPPPGYHYRYYNYPRRQFWRTKGLTSFESSLDYNALGVPKTNSSRVVNVIDKIEVKTVLVGPDLCDILQLEEIVIDLT